MNKVSNEQMLESMNKMIQDAQNQIQQQQQAQESGFGNVLSNAINGVNDAQSASRELSQAYQMGTPGVALSDVMIASQKASISFQALMQVRNKVVEAYKEVMNMPL